MSESEPKIQFRKEVIHEVRNTRERAEASELVTPRLSLDYLRHLPELIETSEDGVTRFYGGPLELHSFGKDTTWFSPVEVKDKQGSSQFQILYLNCKPGDEFNDGVEVKLSLTSEIDLRLGNKNNPEVLELEQLITAENTKQQVIIRPSFLGSLYYPSIYTPGEISNPDTVYERLEKMCETLDIPLPEVEREAFNQQIEECEFNGVWAEIGDIFVSNPREIFMESGKVFVYDILSPNDPWQYYQLIGPVEIPKINRNSNIPIRIDSGCDIGQMYHDQGCDCRVQLFLALEEMNGRMQQGEEPGFVFHAPTQDGRGYGLATKMITEAYKQGVQAPFNEAGEEMDTIAAAERFFGPHDYDLRTYDGVGRILHMLGIRNVSLLTDNKKKIEQLKATGIAVSRQPTNILENGVISDVTRRHLKAKHGSDQYLDHE